MNWDDAKLHCKETTMLFLYVCVCMHTRKIKGVQFKLTICFNYEVYMCTEQFHISVLLIYIYIYIKFCWLHWRLLISDNTVWYIASAGQRISWVQYYWSTIWAGRWESKAIRKSKKFVLSLLQNCAKDLWVFINKFVTLFSFATCIPGNWSQNTSLW